MSNLPYDAPIPESFKPVFLGGAFRDMTRRKGALLLALLSVV